MTATGPRVVTTNWTRIANLNLRPVRASAPVVGPPRLVPRPAAPVVPAMRVLRTHRVAA